MTQRAVNQAVYHGLNGLKRSVMHGNIVGMSSQKKPVRTRFAPSPTGFVHIGNFRTALFAYLFAKHKKGQFILRIEDTDQNRKMEGAIEVLLRTMQTMGLAFDEGYYIAEDGTVKEQGEHGPYLQSQRLEIYQKHVQELIQKKNAYYCFCSEERLEELKKEQIALKKPSMYDRLCRSLVAEEVFTKLDNFKTAEKNPVVRFAVPLEGSTTIHDVIYGDVTYEHAVLDDQIIQKSDGFPTYHLAVVVDDHYMEITHVIRGDEWIPSTPKHILLYEAFGWEPTVFAHAPLILNADKSKLSKRQGDVAVEDYLTKGYLPAALINFVAFLGWNPKTEQEIFSLGELVTEFKLSKVNKSPAVFDIHKLDWMNSKYIREKSDSELAELLIPYWKEAGLLSEQMATANGQTVTTQYLQAIASLEKERLKKLSEIGERTAYFFNEPEYDASLLVWKKSDASSTKTVLSDLHDLLVQCNENDFTKESLESKIKTFIAEKSYDNGSVLWPLRVSMTGLPASPGPFEVTATLALGLGKDKILERLQTAITKL